MDKLFGLTTESQDKANSSEQNSSQIKIYMANKMGKKFIYKNRRYVSCLISTHKVGDKIINK